MPATASFAPLQFLAGNGPVLLYNGQEVGEPGAGFEGFSSDDGRSTTFDYWCMPEFARWVNGHAYDGGGLSSSQRSLRAYYCALLALCQDPSVRGSGYWGLKYFNRSSVFGDCPDDLYTFARFQNNSGRLLLVVANFHPNSDTTGTLRIPKSLADAAGLANPVKVRLILDRSGSKNDTIATTTREALAGSGFSATVPNQTALVFAVGSP
jgi:hypothetical protein